jgi:uncharacterized cupredoxin-like copper-binding protein
VLLFAPNLVWVSEGETVSFQIVNTGTVEHEFMVGLLDDAFAGKPGTPEIEGIKGGSTVELPYTFKGPGPYAFACHETGHFEAGQIGYIIVVGPDVPKVGTITKPRLVGLKVGNGGFNRPNVPATAGETVTFIVSNVGTAPHEFEVGPAEGVAANNVDQITVVTTGPILAGHVTTLTYSFPAGGGGYAFASHAGADDSAGLKGTITLR